MAPNFLSLKLAGWFHGAGSFRYQLGRLEIPPQSTAPRYICCPMVFNFISFRIMAFLGKTFGSRIKTERLIRLCRVAPCHTSERRVSTRHYHLEAHGKFPAGRSSLCATSQVVNPHVRLEHRR